MEVKQLHSEFLVSLSERDVASLFTDISPCESAISDYLYDVYEFIDRVDGSSAQIDSGKTLVSISDSKPMNSRDHTIDNVVYVGEFAELIAITIDGNFRIITIRSMNKFEYSHIRSASWTIYCEESQIKYFHIIYFVIYMCK